MSSIYDEHLVGVAQAFNEARAQIDVVDRGMYEFIWLMTEYSKFSPLFPDMKWSVLGRRVKALADREGVAAL